MPNPRCLFLTALAALAGCDIGIPAFGESSGVGITAPSGVSPRSVDVTPLNGSGIVGSVSIFLSDQPTPRIRASIWFPQLGNPGAGVRYPMHIHQGGACGGGGAMIHDFGARVAVFDQSSPYPVAAIDTVLPAAHLLSGYYLDVHAENDAGGVALGCAVFPW